MVVAPSARVRSAGPMATVSVPATTTSALTVPAGTVRLASFGFSRPGATTAPPARTSTAGAAAVCRTVTRAWPAGTADTSLTNGVRTGVPVSVRCATTVAFAPAGTVTSSAFAAGVVLVGSEPAG